MNDWESLQETLSRTLASQRVDLDALSCSETIRPTEALLQPSTTPSTEITAESRPTELSDVERAVEIGDELARGGMGVVHLAEQRALQREVVVKTLRPEGRNDMTILAMIREARLSARVAHPNTVPIYTLGWSATEGPVIVMKRVRGRAWSTCIDTLNLERNLEILLDVSNAIEYAHAQGVIHRDIKPENVMLGDFGEVYLVDWGIALELGTPRRPGEILGTPAYMAPEMVDPSLGEIGPHTDIYLLGATLHELLTGEPRHQAQGPVGALMEAARSEPHDYPEAVPEELAALCNRACNVSAEARFQSIPDFRDAIHRYLQHRSSVITTRGALEQLALLEGHIEATSTEDTSFEAHRLYGAARTGFEQALEQWPENARARAGLERAVRVMVEHELEARNARFAALLLDQLDGPEPELEARLESLQAELREQEAAGERLEAIKSGFRFHGTDWGRSLITLFNGVFVAAVLVAAGWMHRTDVIHITAENSTLALALAAIAQGAAIRFFRAHLLDSRIYARSMAMLLALGLILTGNHAAALITRAPLELVIVGDCILAVGLLVAASITISRAFIFGSVVACLATTLAVFDPSYGIELWGLSYLANNLYISWVMRPGNDVQDPILLG